MSVVHPDANMFHCDLCPSGDVLKDVPRTQRLFVVDLLPEAGLAS